MTKNVTIGIHTDTWINQNHKHPQWDQRRPQTKIQQGEG